MSLKLVRQDCEGSEQPEPIVLGVGKHVLGRGLPLKCKDSRISRNHCVLEMSEGGKTTLTATHINPCFYTSMCQEASVKILRKGEDSLLINDGDFISLLPDAYKFSVSLIKDGATNGGESETDMETETQEIPDQNNQTKEHVNESSISNSNNGDRADLDNDKTVNLSDNEIAFNGSDDSGAEDDGERDGTSSPSLLDGVPPSLLENHPNHKGESSTKTDENGTSQSGGSSGISENTMSEKRLSDPAGGEGPDAKRHRPNSPQDVKPDLVSLKALISTASNSETEPQNTASVKAEPADDKEAVNVKQEPSDKAEADSVAGSSGGAGAGVDPDSDAGADVKLEDPAQAGGSVDPAKPTPARTKCSFGLGCYRKNALHREEYSHPGDADFTAPTPCQFGAACYRLNPQHRALFTHPGPPAPRPPPPAPNQPGTKQSPTKKRAAKMTKRKRPSYSGTDSEDEYDMEDPFLAADSSDDYQPESDCSSSNEDNEEEDEESQNTRRENRRMLKEANKFTGKK